MNSFSISLKLPLEHSLIISSDTENVSVESSSSELDSDDVLRMTSQTLGLMTLSAWVSEESDESIVVTNANGSLILAQVNTVDMGTISA